MQKEAFGFQGRASRQKSGCKKKSGTNRRIQSIQSADVGTDKSETMKAYDLTVDLHTVSF